MRSLFCLVLLFAAGCTTVQPARVAAFSQGVGKVQLQLDTTFTSINQLVTEDEIDRAAGLPTLSEANFVVVVSRADVAKWDSAMSAISSYAANLTLLLSPDNANNFGKASEDLGTQLTKLGVSVPDGVATGFAELGRVLIEAKAEKDALAAARKADPAIQTVFSEMAAAIGANNLKGLRSDAWAHGLDRMAALVPEFLSAKPGSARRDIVVSYVDLRDKRDAQDLQLGLLYQSLLDLAAVHSALAKGSDADLAASISLLQQELDATRALSDFFKSLTPPAKAKS